MPSVSTVNTIITEILEIFYSQLNLIMQAEFHFTYYTPRGKTTKGTRDPCISKSTPKMNFFFRHKKTVFLGTND